jgi:hypothetical protein
MSQSGCSVVEILQIAMPSVMLGRERCKLPIGETRVGGAGDDALPFPALRQLPTVAVLLVMASETVSLWPNGDQAGTVTVNGVPLGAEPVAVTHGTKIEVGGLRLIFRDGRETGNTGPAATVTREQSELPGVEDASVPIAEEARLVRQSAGTAVPIIDSGLVIGRDPDSDLVVSGMEVSRRHAVLRRSPRGYVLTDVSTNGSYVNGRRIDGSRVLRAGDVIRIGEEEFRFEGSAGAHDPAATPPALGAQSSAEAPTAPPAGGGRRRRSKLWRP